MDAYIYPEADRDNFGQEVGLIQYDFKWHPGDRFTVLSDGHFDLFSEGLRTFFLGAVVTRPTRSNYAVGFSIDRRPDQQSNPVQFHNLSNQSQVDREIWQFLRFRKNGEPWTKRTDCSCRRIVFGWSRFQLRFPVAIIWDSDSRSNRRFLSGKLSRVGGIPIPPVGYRDLE